MFRCYFLSKIIGAIEAFDRRLNDIRLNKSNLHLCRVKNKNDKSHDLTTILSVFTRHLVLFLLRVSLVTTMVAHPLKFIKIDSFIAVAIAVTAFFIGFIVLGACLLGLHKTNYKRLHFQNYINLHQFVLFVSADENKLLTVK